MPKFAANLTMLFGEMPFLDRFAAAKAAGFSGVEYLFPYEFEKAALREQLQQHGLTQVLHNLPAGNWAAGERGIASLPDRAEEFRSSVATALRYADATGVKRLHVMSGNADRRNPANVRAYEDALRHASDAAAPKGLVVVIEPINGRDMPNYFLNDFNYAVDMIVRLGLPNLRLQYDVYHRQILHGDVLKSLAALMPLVAHMQIAAVPDRNEPGTGELDDARVFRTIDQLGYSGYVGCEYRPANGTLPGLSWMRALGV